MKILQPNEYIITLIQFTLPAALYFGLTSNAEWYWWLLSAFLCLVYIFIGNNLAQHRYYSHNEFTIGKAGEFIFGWAALTLCIGSPVSYAILHLTHHKHPTSGPDWTWKDLPFYKHIWFDHDTIQPYIGKRVIELHKKYGWMHDYNLIWVVAYPAILWSIDYKLFLFGWWIPCTVAMLEIALAVYFQHRRDAHNSKWHKWVPTYEGLHKNHHDFPGQSNNAKDPGQIDYTYIISKLFVKKYKNDTIA